MVGVDVPSPVTVVFETRYDLDPVCPKRCGANVSVIAVESATNATSALDLTAFMVKPPAPLGVCLFLSPPLKAENEGRVAQFFL
jgi:hypothetical protein